MNRIIKKGILYFLSLFFVLLLSLLSSGNYIYALGEEGHYIYGQIKESQFK